MQPYRARPELQIHDHKCWEEGGPWRSPQRIQVPTTLDIDHSTAVARRPVSNGQQMVQAIVLAIREVVVKAQTEKVVTLL